MDSQHGWVMPIDVGVCLYGLQIEFCEAESLIGVTSHYSVKVFNDGPLY